ncbi:MAG: nicotinate-nucleotide--dimethylbenzimidazole phosphoribosyltransferase [Veillonella sp.]|uniref:nicotinate-nucleotide--dimethylbenzimidazole phosphoribosyltransferase n=1 Tax=Veillonella sp. TaxID=1926307 RepID=UPI0025CEEF80|nr:nicotinate-nucleotide--dimethylbenzimidazole phosphoribosyltransferase [Veillonella sp.]MBS4914272.1 nicotinate-nucleotide--dimethylbenzimidazole phosphoribosyltransferase [Veillonella sp.]
MKEITIKPLNGDCMTVCRTRVDNLTKPLYSLAKLEEIAVRLAGIFENEQPKSVKKGIIIFAGDTAVDGPQNHTKGHESKAVVARLAEGPSPTGAMAERLNAPIYVVDSGLEQDTTDLTNVIQKKVNNGSRFFGMHPAFENKADVDALLQAGADLAEEMAAQGIDAIGVGTIGERSLLSGLALTKAITQYDMAELLTDNECTLSIREKAERLQMTMARYGLEEAEAVDILAAVGSPEIVMLTGFLLKAASLQRAVVFDTAVTGAAVLAAAKINPLVKDYVFPSVAYNEPVHKAQMKYLGFTTYLNYDLAVDEAVGSTLGLSLLDASLHMLNDMKTFGEAEVTVAEDGPGNILQDGR